MAEVTISLKHVASQDEEPCGVCGAAFIPAEDSGSRSTALYVSVTTATHRARPEETTERRKESAFEQCRAGRIVC